MKWVAGAGGGGRGLEVRKRRKEGAVVGGWGTERRGTVSPVGPAVFGGPRVCGGEWGERSIGVPSWGVSKG